MLFQKKTRQIKERNQYGLCGPYWKIWPGWSILILILVRIGNYGPGIYYINLEPSHNNDNYLLQNATVIRRDLMDGHVMRKVVNVLATKKYQNILLENNVANVKTNSSVSQIAKVSILSRRSGNPFLSSEMKYGFYFRL